MRFRKQQQGSWWWLGKLCDVSRCLLWSALWCRCPIYNVSRIFFNKSLYFSCYMAGYLLGRTCIFKTLIISEQGYICISTEWKNGRYKIRLFVKRIYFNVFLIFMIYSNCASVYCQKTKKQTTNKNRTHTVFKVQSV